MLGSEFTCDGDLVKGDFVAIDQYLLYRPSGDELTKPSLVAGLLIRDALNDTKRTHHPGDQHRPSPCSAGQASLAKEDARL